MAARNFRHAPQPAIGLWNHAGGTLHSRFKHEGGVGISLFLLRGKFLFHLADTFPPAAAIIAGVGAFGLGAVERTTVAIRRHHLIGWKQHSAVSFVKQINVAERDCADGVAVIRAGERKEAGLHRFTARAPGKFVGQLERHFQRRRTVVAVKHFVQVGRGY